MGQFEEEYKRLNTRQKEAVDAIDGPVLVVAGPGTGKTQLLSMRVANIIKQTDASPSNILCLTFTDNAARNMRERLETIIGQSAYHVAIHTFHSFGSDVINQYSDYFLDRQLLQQVDELGRYELMKDIFERLPHGNPLTAKIGDDFVHLKDTLDAISWCKQNALTPAELHEIINANKAFMETISDELSECFASTPSPKQLTAYNKLLASIQTHITGQQLFGFPEYAAGCAAELKQAIAGTAETGRYAPQITAWRNAWCLKNAEGKHVFKDAGRNLRKMHALANAYQELIDAMAEKGLYDFDDMIVEVVRAMEREDELRFSLQERFQYVLVDEFQDTNKAQLRILEALGDNSVYEGRPNIMAVGDDDQAIYAFQGALASNMVAFADLYRDPALITLEDNYRSTADILSASFTVAGQIRDRLESVLPAAGKSLIPRAAYKESLLRHNEFVSELAQYDWIAEEIERLIAQGAKPEDIAVIAPRHRYLERLMPYLGARKLPVAYERRENILDSPIILQLLSLAELVNAIAENRQDDVDTLISQVLGYEFWGIPAEEVLTFSLDCYKSHKHWLELLPRHKNAALRTITSWLIDLAKHSSIEPLEYMLDRLLGAEAEGVDSADDELLPPQRGSGFTSPMRQYYFSSERYEAGTDGYLALLGQLSTLRQRLRQWKPATALYLKDLVEFAELHRSAHLKIIDTNPHTQTTNAVQVMTAYKAKGLEFGTVFVINAQDEIWGPTSRSRASNITLPKNLPIAPASDGDNDKLRLLFVALTRAKHTLYITSYSHTLENKLSPGLSFLGSVEEPVHPAFTPHPIDKPATVRAAEILATDWAYRYRQVIADKPTLFQPILDEYKLSVTHLNNFTDVFGGGPRYFLLHNLLRFPEAPTPSAAYGDAVHQTLQWTHSELKRGGKLPAQTKMQAFFSDILARKHLRATDHSRLDRRGREALGRYFSERPDSLLTQDIVERGFNNEGVVVSGARLSGKIDKLRFIDAGSAQVVDFKTGKPASDWKGKDEHEKIKLHKYRQQLLFYKLLVEGSASFRGKLAAASGALEFIEPNEQGKMIDNLEMSFDPEELARFERLVGAVWARIMKLDFPDISGYPQNLKGVQQFEQDLIEDTVK